MLASMASNRSELLHDVINWNCRWSEVSKSAPIEPHRVGLVGLWYYAKLLDNNQFIYPFEARVMGGMMGRLMDVLDEDWKESSWTYWKVVERTRRS